MYVQLSIFSAICIIGMVSGVALTYMMSDGGESPEDKYQNLNEADGEEQEKKIKDPLARINKEMRSNFVLLIILVILGTLGGIFLEGWHWIDALQFTFVTMSTVGYGDISPTTRGGIVFMSIYIVIGVAMLGRFGATIMDRVLTQKKLELTDKIINSTLTDARQIPEFDADGDGTIDRYEYLVKMLVITEECSPFAIHRIMERFEQIDSDKNGTISVAELVESFEKEMQKQRTDSQELDLLECQL